MRILIIGIITFAITISCTTQEKNQKVQEMDEKLAQFAPVAVSYDSSLLDERQKVVVEKLYQAALIMDELFLEQVYSGNRAIKAELQQKDDPYHQKALEYFNIMFGPFDRLEENEPFYGEAVKPLGANFYPEDMSREEFEQWLKDNPQDSSAFMGTFTIVRRQGDKLVAVPYSEAYGEQLQKAASLLREAAEYADNPTLKTYLETRADAFLSNDYFESDMAWMDLKDHTIEIVIGPYEVYEDALFNYKAAFECFLTLRDPEESAKLARFASYLNDMEANLPISEEHKNFDRGSESPIVVVNEVFSAGDTKAGVQTLAFNLPNDERVREAKGSKKVMLKNIHKAKFEKQMLPIAEIVLSAEDAKNVTFDGFFNHTLMHEMSHGIGPGVIEKNGKKTEVKIELKETYSTFEECKADILGMYNNIFMIEKGEYAPEFENEIWSTFLAGVFRSIRFGINEAHGGGNAMIFNYMLEKGAYNFDPETEKVSVNRETVYDVLTEMARDVLLIQATGDYQGARAFMAKYAVDSPVLITMREKMKSIPVDIKPVFDIEENR